MVEDWRDSSFACGNFFGVDQFGVGYLALVDWVEAYLNGWGVTAHRVYNADRTKAALYAHIGPEVAGGVILSGHSDVVPVDGQPWTSDPWVVTERDGRLYGRGTCDMKGFVALALAAVPGVGTQGQRALLPRDAN